MSEAAARPGGVAGGSRLPQPGGSRLPQPRFGGGAGAGIPRPKTAAASQTSRVAASSTSNLASSRVTRQSLSAPDLTRVGVAQKPGLRGTGTAQNSLLRKAVATASSRVAPASTAAANRKRPATTGQPGPDKKRPLVDSNKQQTDKKVPVPVAPAKRGKPAPWDIKSRLEHANAKISKLSEENDYLTTAAAEAVTTQQLLVDSREQCESLEAKLTDTKSQLDIVTLSEKKWKDEAEQALAELDKIRKEHQSLSLDFSNIKSEYHVVMESESKLKNQVASLNSELEQLKQSYAALSTELRVCQERAEARDRERVLQLFNEQQAKRVMLNTILDLKGNIRVFCRVRPPLNSESEKALLTFNFPNEATLEVKTTEKGKTQPAKNQPFTYDKVYTPQSSQQDIYDELSALVQSALDGHNVCVFAYGQTGSGKTYTMQGGSDSNSEGMIPRSIKTIYQAIKDQNQLGWKFTVKCSFLEIYNENIHDLLNPNSGLTYEVKMVDNVSEKIYVSNLKVVEVDSEKQLQDLLDKAQRRRFTASTIMNNESSRSHSITQIKLEGFNEAQNLTIQGNLNLIDLAGSEKYRSENQADRKAETLNINRSLQTLSLVVLKLAEKAEHIPFRDSKLTHLLMPSLKGNSKTLMMVNIAPFEDCQSETLNALRFAARVSTVKIDSKRQVKSSLSQPSSSSKSTK
ncbi:protein claret segregational [Thrips palmi]|uniref:Protein claret segregational n=1 Tax=Thrips palmi TaxID=161013 RepID=A0A6P9A2E3_THRPL|nr:protein claret segregational [Thrips palmi]